MGVLLGEDGVGDAAPQGKGLIGELLFTGRNDLGSDGEWGNVNDGVLVFDGVRGLVSRRTLISRFKGELGEEGDSLKAWDLESKQSFLSKGHLTAQGYPSRGRLGYESYHRSPGRN